MQVKSGATINPNKFYEKTSVYMAIDSETRQTWGSGHMRAASLSGENRRPALDLGFASSSRLLQNVLKGFVPLLTASRFPPIMYDAFRSFRGLCCGEGCSRPFVRHSIGWSDIVPKSNLYIDK